MLFHPLIVDQSLEVINLIMILVKCLNFIIVILSCRRHLNKQQNQVVSFEVIERHHEPVFPAIVVPLDFLCLFRKERCLILNQLMKFAVLSTGHTH